MNQVNTDDAGHSLDDFVESTAEQHAPTGPFAVESERMLRIDVDGRVFLKAGAAIAHRGEIVFERVATLEAGSLKEAALREMAPLVSARGRGRLYCAHHGAHVRLVTLRGESIVVSWQELLAFEASLASELTLLAHGVGVAAGGMVCVRLSGEGTLALAVHGRPLTLIVTPDQPVSTDPHATLAWSAALSPELTINMNWRALLAHGGQEPFEMRFAGSGFVVVQPFEDASRFHLELDPLNRIKSLIAGP